MRSAIAAAAVLVCWMGCVWFAIALIRAWYGF